MVLLVAWVGLVLASFTLVSPIWQPAGVVARMPAHTATVLTGKTGAELTVQASQAVWESSPVAIVANSDSAEGAASEAAAEAAELRIPAFEYSGEATPALRSELTRLGTRAVLAIGDVTPAQLGGIKVVTDPAALPAHPAVTPLTDTVTLRAAAATPAQAVVAVASLAAAGAPPVDIAGSDPRSSSASVQTIATARASHFVAVGAKFGAPDRLATRLAAASTGTLLPGGGQTILAGKRYVALYGHPAGPALGILGEQDPQASVQRARRLAQQYQAFTNDQVIPAFEIIATVAAGQKGKDGNYSREWSIASLRPFVDAAISNGLYVVLDLQPGRAKFLDQAKRYEPLLRLPGVGLALDPEWKLTATELPMRQIGSVDVSEVNQVVRWLAKLTRKHHLPQKMLVVHQFQPQMIVGFTHLDMSHDELACLGQMDGTGTMASKLNTWAAVRAHGPAGLRWGWKNFVDEDRPTPTPALTMAVRPQPYWVSYQ